MHDNRSPIHGIKSSSSGFVALVLWSSLFSTIPLFTFHFMIHQRYGLPCTCTAENPHNTMRYCYTHIHSLYPSSSFLLLPVDDVVHTSCKRYCRYKVGFLKVSQGIYNASVGNERMFKSILELFSCFVSLVSVLQFGWEACLKWQDTKLCKTVTL